jgi:F-type H+-transporting ATPase subunit delta
LNENSIARRYARAVFDLAVEAQQFEEVGRELARVRAALEADPSLLEVLRDPRITREERQGVAGALIEALGTGSIVANTLRLMADRARLAEVPALEQVYRQLADERAGRVRAQVVSARPLTEDDARHIAQLLERVTRRNVILERRVDPGLLGGVVARVGSRVYDGSLRNQFERLEKQLKA